MLLIIIKYTFISESLRRLSDFQSIYYIKTSSNFFCWVYINLPYYLKITKFLFKPIYVHLFEICPQIFLLVELPKFNVMFYKNRN